MSAIFGELMSFDQENGPEIKLRVFGDEFYARYETEEGYTAIYDDDLGRSPPPGLEKHLEESDEVRLDKAAKRFSRR